MKARFRTPRFFLCFSVFFLISFPVLAQVGINTTEPKAMLDVESDDSGILIPRVALTAANVEAPVVDAQVSEMIYNTATAGSGANAVSPGFYYWNGTIWVPLTTGSGGGSDDKWNLIGNAGTDPTSNFVGTTDAQPLHFKSNNVT